MKAKDFKCPFTWSERRPLFSDRVLLVPEYYDRHAEEWSFPGWEDPLFFGREGAPVYIEYCSGNGAWIIEKARRHPEQNWIAVEKRFDRVRKIWARAKKFQLNNLIVVDGEAQPFTKYYLPEASVDGVYVNFPDPWPKERHAKHRLLQEPFVSDMARILKKGASAVFVTDDEPYCQQIISVMLENGAWDSVIPDPYFTTEWCDYGTSFFDELWRTKGRHIRYMQFNKKDKLKDNRSRGI